MRRYTIVIEVDDEEYKTMNENWVINSRRDVVRNRQKVFLQVLKGFCSGLDLIEGSIVDFRPSRSKVDLKPANERLKPQEISKCPHRRRYDEMIGGRDGQD